MTISQADLPSDWGILDAERARGLEQQLQHELADVHRLNGVPVQAIAARSWNDDVLYRHADAEDRWSVVHLTWSQVREQCPNFPWIEFTGSFAEFVNQFPPPNDDATRA